jgi:hypothetical protein
MQVGIVAIQTWHSPSGDVRSCDRENILSCHLTEIDDLIAGNRMTVVLGAAF